MLLDEPTNHLDMRSTEFLAAALADFDGSLCTISHDRYFLDGIVNRVWEVRPNSIREYIGNYSDYEDARAKELENAPRQSVILEGKKSSTSQSDKERKRQEAEERNQRHRKLKPLQSRLEKLERELETLVEKKSRVESELAEPDLHTESEKPRLLETLRQQSELVRREKELMQEWETLSLEIESLE